MNIEAVARRQALAVRAEAERVARAHLRRDYDATRLRRKLDDIEAIVFARCLDQLRDGLASSVGVQ